MASSVLQGASIGPLIELAIEFDPRYLCHPSIFIRQTLITHQIIYWYLGIKCTLWL